MKYKKIYYTIGTIPKTKGKIVERTKSIILRHVYMTTPRLVQVLSIILRHVYMTTPRLVQVLQQNRAGLNKLCWQNPSLFVK